MVKARDLHIDADYECEMYQADPSPEHRLLAALLSRAILDLCSKDTAIARDALAWFRCKSKREDGFNYTNVMEELNFTPTQRRMISTAIIKAHYGKCMREGEEGGAEYCFLAKVPRRRVS